MQSQSRRRTPTTATFLRSAEVAAILQFAEDEGAIASNPVRKVPPPKRRPDPEQLLGEAKRRAYTPQEAGRLLGRMPLSWWDHVLVFLGTGLRFGELAGLRCRRVHLDRSVPVLQVVEVRYQAGGQFGSGFKGRPKSDAGIRELPLAPLVVSPSAGSSHPTPIRRSLSSPARAAATGSPPARGRCCRATTSTASISGRWLAPARILLRSIRTVPTTYATPFRPGWRTP